ncbi:flagellar biosynthetic protein FliO [Maridesulfovibrio bastinii]|uniref:flagellar biosynthetic protein FliO n=1 Tax=Maridesulfovibrio bastinii TaxID=47157 RepID=UPI0004876765|nr:flagellar biosynthetic protein FliO [Maridesulfovibrio bastinii]
MPNATEPLMLPDAGVGASLKVAAAFCLVLALLLLLYYLMRKFNVASMISGSRKGNLEIVERLPLGPRQHIAVVRYKDRELVLGVTQDRINLLDVNKDKADDEDTEDFAGVLEDKRTIS